MSDAIRILIALLVGYGLGALHLWLAYQRREGTAYMNGYRAGQKVSGNRG